MTPSCIDLSDLKGVSLIIWYVLIDNSNPFDVKETCAITVTEYCFSHLKIHTQNGMWGFWKSHYQTCLWSSGLFYLGNQSLWIHFESFLFFPKYTLIYSFFVEGLKDLFLDYGMNISCKKYCFSALTSVPILLTTPLLLVGKI